MKNPFNIECNSLDCPLYNGDSKRVFGYGDINAKFMFIGEAPGIDGADITGVPFTKDKSGKKLQEILYNVGLSKSNNSETWKPDLHDCYVTNIVKCCPKKCNKNRTPTAKEKAICSKYLDQEINLLKNLKIIISIGAHSTKYIFEKFCSIKYSKMKELHARDDIFTNDGKVKIIPMRHTSTGFSHKMEDKIVEVLKKYVGKK